MKKLILTCLIAMSVSKPVFASEGDSGCGFGNGGGSAESNVSYAFLNLDVYLGRAALHRAMKDELSSQMLQTLLSTARAEKRRPELLHFSQDLAQFPESALFKTEAQSFADIFINLDALYPKDAAGQVQPYTLSQSLKLMVLVWSRRNDVYTRAQWENFADRFVAVTELRMERLYFEFAVSSVGRNLMLSLFQDPSLGRSTALLVTDPEKVSDILPWIQAKLGCGNGSSPEALALSGLNWKMTFDYGWAVMATLSQNCSGVWSEAREIGIKFRFRENADKHHVLDLTATKIFLE